ncbi:MAG: type II secretion system F family protein [Clostridia bacterium]
MNRKGILNNEELSVICEQIGLILRAGLPMHDGVEALCENYSGTRYAPKFLALEQGVTETGSLYEGFKAATVFPEYLMEMTRIGEKTGELDSVMEELSVYYDREAKKRRAIQNAVLYPLLLIAMMAVLILVLILQVFPIFENVFRGLGMSASSPWMGVAIGVGKGTLVAAGVLIVLVLVALLALRLDSTGRCRRLLFRLFSPLGTLNRKLYAGRFASTLAMMMRSGYPLEESLELIEGLYEDPFVKKQVAACRLEMATGISFPEAVEKIGLFDKLHCRMISVGFRAGQTDRVMSKLASLYEEEVETQISHLVSIIEPSLVALMSVIIGAIMLAVMLPLLSIMNGMA